MSDGAVNGKYAPRPGNIPGVKINLGGVELVLAPLGLRLVREFEARAKTTSENATAESTHEFYIDVILASLNRNYPDLSREELEMLLDSHNEQQAFLAVFTQSGLERAKPGEIKPGG